VIAGRGVGHQPTEGPEVRRVALDFDEREPDRFKDNPRQAKEMM
jgi:5-oxopent-3-ene-1,2,5-tricarboxylate decarboxylase/2-hydroxyhepta-2,4-diene-1,7-dioate isomerase